jgi:ribosomal protein S18 acetylase RimI-like enzyme
MEKYYMDKSIVALRQANPTEDDGLAFAKYLDEAAEGFFRFMLGRRAKHIIAEAFTFPDHDLSYQNVTFAERDKLIVGMISGYSAEQHRRSSLAPLNRAAGWWNLRMKIVQVVFAPLLRIIDSISDEDFYLQAFAIDKEHRGNGIGSLLMDSLEEKARASGSARLALDVSAKNENAFRLYLHRGLTIESKWPKRLHIFSFQLFRMTKMI